MKGFGILILPVAATAFALQASRASGASPLCNERSYLPPGVLVSYWTQLTAASVVVTIIASIAGALLVATHRSVMVALALVPSAALSGMGAAAGDFAVALKGFLRLILEIFLVLASPRWFCSGNGGRAKIGGCFSGTDLACA